MVAPAHSHKDRTPVWLWPNLLSLDAPVVALVWQEALAAAVGAELTPGHRWLLFLAVWFLYVVDRVLDAARLPLEVQAPRHRAHGKGRQALLPLVGLAAVAGVWLAILQLDRPAWWAVGGLCLATAGHYLWTHRRPWAEQGVGWKPWRVGLVFAAGCAVQPAMLGEERLAWLLAIPLLGVLFGLNCFLISAWERAALQRGPVPRRPALLPWGAALVAWGSAFGVGLGSPHYRLVIAWILAALALLGLDRTRDFLSLDARRALADAVLLTPLITGMS